VTDRRWFNRSGFTNGGVHLGADWSTDVIADVERWSAEDGADGCPAAWVHLGVADPREDGLLALGGRDLRVDVRDPCLSGEKGPEHEQCYPVEAVHDEDGLLVLRPPSDLPERSRHVWVRTAPVLDGLLDGLRVAGEAPLARALAERRLGAAPSAGAAGQAGDQPDPVRGCLGPGLRVVWAPPGSAHALARAVAALVDDGKRVLLVAPSEAAVDDAVRVVARRMAARDVAVVRVGAEPPLAAAQVTCDAEAERAAAAAESAEVDPAGGAVCGVVGRVPPGDGVVVRGGAEPGRPVAEGEVGEEGVAAAAESAEVDPVGGAVCGVVGRVPPGDGVVRGGGEPERPAAAAAALEVEEERAAVAAELAELDAIDTEIGRLEAELADFDEEAYRAAVARVAAERDLADLRPRLRAAEAAAEDARRAVVAATTELREAVDAQAGLVEVREAFEAERRAVEGLAVLEQRQRALIQGRAALEEAGRGSGWRGRRRLRRQVAAAEAELVRFTAVVAAGRRRWLDVRLRARAVIGERTWADVEAADERAAAAARAVTHADEAYRRARELLVGLRRAVEEAEAWGQATDEDRRLVARRLLHRRARLRELTERRERAAARRQALAARPAELDQRAGAEEARLVGQARVVATTLARARLHPALTSAEFDAVLVDGAGVAALPEVLVALCRATETAVLFGHTPLTGFATGFSHLGIVSAADAAAREGCVVLPDVGIPEQRACTGTVLAHNPLLIGGEEVSLDK